MPKARPLGMTLEEKQIKQLRIETRKAIADCGMEHNKDAAAALRISEQCFSNRMKNGCWTLTQLGELFRKLRFSDEAIIRVMRGAT